MKTLTLPITKSARQFGYVIWPGHLNDKITALLNGASTIHLHFMGTDLGEKRVDWKYHRISIGYRWTRRLPTDVSNYILTFRGENTLNTTCR